MRPLTLFVIISCVFYRIKSDNSYWYPSVEKPYNFSNPIALNRSQNTNSAYLYRFKRQTFDDDFLVSKNSTSTMFRAGFKHDVTKWPLIGDEYIIPFSLKDFPEVFYPNIYWAFEYIRQNTNIRFIKRGKEINYIWFVLGDDCRSFAGILDQEIAKKEFGRSGQPVMLTPECNLRHYILHELGHVIGLTHEHQRIDRDQFIDMYSKDPETKIDPNIDLITPYEVLSIMHYDSHYTGSLVFEPKDHLLSLIAAEKRSLFTSCDLNAINLMYQGPIKSPACRLNMIENWIVPSQDFEGRVGTEWANWTCQYGNAGYMESGDCGFMNNTYYPPALRQNEAPTDDQRTQMCYELIYNETRANFEKNNSRPIDTKNFCFHVCNELCPLYYPTITLEKCMKVNFKNCHSSAFMPKKIPVVGVLLLFIFNFIDF